MRAARSNKKGKEETPGEDESLKRYFSNNNFEDEDEGEQGAVAFRTSGHMNRVTTGIDQARDFGIMDPTRGDKLSAKVVSSLASNHRIE